MTALQVVSDHPDGSVLTVWVVPGASRTEIVGFHGDALRVRVAAPPERGRANQALLDHLSESLGTAVLLAGGSGSRRKQVVVPGVAVADLVDRVGNLVN